jgi:hypothetical protein
MRVLDATKGPATNAVEEAQVQGVEIDGGSRMPAEALTCRTLLRTTVAGAVWVAVKALSPARGWAAPPTAAAEPTEASGGVVDLTIRRQLIRIAGRVQPRGSSRGRFRGRCCASGRARP